MILFVIPFIVMHGARADGMASTCARSASVVRTAILEVASVVLEVQRTPVLVVQALDVGRADGCERGSLPAPDRRECRVTIWRLHPCPLRLQSGCINEPLQDAIAQLQLDEEAPRHMASVIRRDTVQIQLAKTIAVETPACIQSKAFGRTSWN